MSHIAIAGDVHGKILLLYEKVAKLQKEIESPIEAILQVGDLQLYSDDSKVDNAVRRHNGPGEFPSWFREKRTVPILTYAILGNHDDADLFYQYAGKEILPSLFLMAQGQVISVKIGNSDLRIAALGGNYSPKFFETNPDDLPQGRKRHYTKAHIDSILDNAPVDILFTHEAPTGFIKRRGGDVGRPEIKNLIENLQPKLAFFGHHHQYVTGKIKNTVVTGLAGIERSGSIILLKESNNNLSVAQSI